MEGSGEPDQPRGYRLLSISDFSGRERVVGNDNHWPKRHHWHVLEEEGPYTYKGIDTLIGDFKVDVARVRRRSYEG